MKRLLLITLLSLILLPSVAFSQQPPPAAQARQQANQQLQQMNIRTREIELGERELELQRKEAELNFQREQQNIELERLRMELENTGKTQKDKLQPLLLLVLIIHILCAVWVYQDIQKLAYGSGIWIAISLLTGLLGTLVYAVVRLGNSAKHKS